MLSARLPRSSGQPCGRRVSSPGGAYVTTWQRVIGPPAPLSIERLAPSWISGYRHSRGATQCRGVEGVKALISNLAGLTSTWQLPFLLFSPRHSNSVSRPRLSRSAHQPVRQLLHPIPHSLRIRNCIILWSSFTFLSFTPDLHPSISYRPASNKHIPPRRSVSTVRQRAP